MQTIGSAARDGTQQVLFLLGIDFFFAITTRPAVLGCWVSGTSILEIKMVPGAVMITALSRCLGSTPKAMYAAMMPPET